ncbi:hypothetical protein OUZ56_030912 [Daphnia magna]|uniref:Uncharacterized protein n=1 Tax=Daphnia magna TaxID=35525 RepID=A0ABQ9ZSP8_9CRUS|nr:hypothetical protein OUZ56_030912 [Daphnia magna]
MLKKVCGAFILQLKWFLNWIRIKFEYIFLEAFSQSLSTQIGKSLYSLVFLICILSTDDMFLFKSGYHSGFAEGKENGFDIRILSIKMFCMPGSLCGAYNIPSCFFNAYYLDQYV